MTPEEKTKAMKSHLNSMYGKMTTEPLYADTDSIKVEAPKQDALIEFAKGAILEFKYTACYAHGRIEIDMTRKRFDEFCDCLFSLLEKCDLK